MADLADEPGPGLPLDLAFHVCSLLPPDEVACTARLVCKASAQHFSAPHHRTVRLSQPVPPHAFAARYGRGAADPQPLKGLSLEGKECLLLLTASSGSLANVAALVERMEPPFWWKPKDSECWPQRPRYDPPLWRKVDDNIHCACTKAARNRHMHVVRWLLQRGYPLHVESTTIAVMRHCDLADALWLLAQEPVRSSPGFASGGLPESMAYAVGSSASADAPEKLEWLIAHWNGREDFLRRGVAQGAAEGDNLPALQWVLQDSTALPPRTFLDVLKGLTLHRILEGAARSGAMNVAAWFVGRAARYGYESAAVLDAASEGQTEVLRLLLPRFMFDEQGNVCCMGIVMAEAASSGCLEALQYVWGLAESHGVEVSHEDKYNSALKAIESGSVAAARWLWQQISRPAMSSQAVTAAVKAGGVPMLEFVCDEAGAVWDQRGVALAEVLRSRAPGGPVPLLQWLHERGCAIGCCNWHAKTAVFDDSAAVLRWLYDEGLVSQQYVARYCVLEQAAASGCEAAVEWLLAADCPMGQDGEAYLTAGRNRDFDMLRCLRRLGVPWGPDTVLRAVKEYVPAHVVRWMVGEGGAPLSKQAAEAAPEGSELREVLRAAAAARGKEVAEPWTISAGAADEEDAGPGSAATGAAGVEDIGLGMAACAAGVEGAGPGSAAAGAAATEGGAAGSAASACGVAAFNAKEDHGQAPLCCPWQAQPMPRLRRLLTACFRGAPASRTRSVIAGSDGPSHYAPAVAEALAM